jgi:hypothetical protein
LRWLSNSSALAGLIDTGADKISVLNAMLGAASLRAVLQVWHTSQDRDDEEFWQATLAKHAFVFSQLLAYPVLVIAKKAYVGGKRLDNQHGNIVDFLARASTGNALLIEIKTPGTPLLGKKYRDDVFPPSRDVTGSVSQLLQYRDSLMQEVGPLTRGQVPLLHSEPRCLLVIGNVADQLSDDYERSCFERFRERLVGVTVVGFDELFDRVTQLERLISTPASAVP